MMINEAFFHFPSGSASADPCFDEVLSPWFDYQQQQNRLFKNDLETHTKNHSNEHSKYMWQDIVTNIDVLCEAIENAAERRDIKECHRQTKHGTQEDGMHHVCGSNCSQRKCYRHDALCNNWNGTNGIRYRMMTCVTIEIRDTGKKWDIQLHNISMRVSLDVF